MPPKRTRKLVLDAESHELPSDGREACGIDALLQTLYNDLNATRNQLSTEQARNQLLEIEITSLQERANRFQADRVALEAEIARLQILVSRPQSQSSMHSPLSDRNFQPVHSNAYVFKLEKAAKSRGGDKFVCVAQPDFNIYFPQSISRPNSARPCQLLQLRVEQTANATPASPSLRPVNGWNGSYMKNELVKQEHVSDDDDDEPIVLGYKAGRTSSKKCTSSQ
jgi:hypothetical protein